jgi:hypothetical protein
MSKLNPLEVLGQAKPHRPDDRREEHTNHTLGLRERLRLANKNGELPSTAQLQREGVFGLRPVNRIGTLRKGENLPTYYDIERIKCPHGVYRWKLHEPPRPIEEQEWRNEGRSRQRFLTSQTPKKEIAWEDRKPITGLELWDAAGVR